MADRKKEWGQFFTDPRIANYMARLAYFEEAKTALDPAVGLGALMIPLWNLSGKKIECTGYDLDESLLSHLSSDTGLSCRLFHADYLTSPQSMKYDIILCNPPYNRFQDIPQRREYLSLFQQKYGIAMNGHANLCVYFLIKSLNELSPGGRCVYIMPYEFLNTGYGIAVKKYLTSRRLLKSIIRFDGSLRVFPDAVTTSCILILENRPHHALSFVTLRSLDDLSEPEDHVTLSYDQVSPVEKWNPYFDGQQNITGSFVPFSQYAYVKRGIATGMNQFFMLSRSQIAQLELSASPLIKCICKAPDILSLIFTEECFEALAERDKKIYLFDGSAAKTPNDFAYLQYGESIGAHQTYLTSHRTPWYKIESKEIAPIWISAFSRGSLKVIRNESSAKTLTAFHGIFTHSQNPEEINLFFCYLLTPTAQRLLFQNRREYGGKLNKFEPGDLNHSNVCNLSRLSPAERADILHVYEKLRSAGSHDTEIQFLDSLFQRVCHTP